MGKNSKVIVKGKYDLPQRDPLLTIQNYIFLSENGKRFLLLRWYNARSEALTGLKLSVGFYDASGRLLERRELLFDDLKGDPRSTFVLPPIPVVSGCVDFRADMELSRYGNFTYAADRDEIVAGYAEQAKGDTGRPLPSPVREKPLETDRDVTRRAPIFSAVSIVLFCLLLGCLIFLIGWRLSTFQPESFLKDGVEYAFVYNQAGERAYLRVTGHSGQRKHVTICDSLDGIPVVEIADSAFENHFMLETVTLEGSLKIGNYAFQNCQNLTSINLEEVSEIGNSAFAWCYRLKSVAAYQLESLGANAFLQCESLEEVVISNAEKTLKTDYTPFIVCNQLKSVVIDQRIANFGNHALFETVSIQNLTLTNFSGGKEGVTMRSLFTNPYSCSIGTLKISQLDRISDGFCEEIPVERVEIGSLAEREIGNWAFRNCYLLTEIVIPPVLRVGDQAFLGSAITSFDGSELESIGWYAFADCHYLSSFSMGQYLKQIGNGAFANVRQLQRLEIPSSVESIGFGALQDTGLIELSIPFLGTSRDSNGPLSDIFGYTPSSLKTVTITEPIDRIPDYAFAWCDGLERVILPDTVAWIGDSAFSYCSSLRDFVCPESLAGIGPNAFSDCRNLTRFTLPASLTEIGAYAFLGCSRLYEVKNESRLDLEASPWNESCIAENALTVYGAGEPFAETAEQEGYRFSLFGENWYMVGYPGDIGYLKLPAEFLYGSSYRLPHHLFSYDGEINTISIPAAVEEIGEYAFAYCSRLREAAFAEESKIVSIAEGVFDQCHALTDISLPDGVTSIGSFAFRGCDSLSVFILPEGLNSIGDQAFLACHRLRVVYNLSALPIVKGQETYGYVGAYAEYIYDSLDQPEEEELPEA